MAHMDANDRAQCEALVCEPGAVFYSVYRFLRGRQADRALALEALFHSVRSVSRTVADPGVAMAKLAWWANECRLSNAMTSQHPVLRAVRAGAALDLLDTPEWARYIGAQSTAIDAWPYDLADLERSLRDSGGLEALLLLSLASGDADAESAIRVGMAGALLNHLESLAAYSELPSWVPREMAAAHGLRDDQALLEQRGLPGLVRELVGLALQWTPAGETSWADSGRANRAGINHLLLRRVVEMRRLKRLLARPPTPARPPRAGGNIGEIIAVWNQARRLPAGER